jgi:hypothetical protein
LLFYAKRIGADFNIISERKYPEWPITYEKMQMYECGKKYSCNILMDCDIWLDPFMYDITELVPRGSIGAWMEYDPSITIKEDEFLKLDGSDRVPATNCVVAHSEIHEVWKPFDLPLPVAVSRMKREFVIDEYCVGRNVKKNKIKIVGVITKSAEDRLFIHGNLTTKINPKFTTQINNIK